MKTTKEEKVVEVPADVRMKFLHNGKSFTFEIDYELFSFIKRKRLKTKFLFNIKVDIKKVIIEMFSKIGYDNGLAKKRSHLITLHDLVGTFTAMLFSLCYRQYFIDYERKTN